jgi:hypothetical protein
MHFAESHTADGIGETGMTTSAPSETAQNARNAANRGGSASVKPCAAASALRSMVRPRKVRAGFWDLRGWHALSTGGVAKSTLYLFCFQHIAVEAEFIGKLKPRFRFPAILTQFLV